MNINDALNKICVYSSILGCGKDTDKGSLLECFGVSLYNAFEILNTDILLYHRAS